MPQKTLKTPSYRLHKPTGLAVVRLNGRDFYLGRHGTSESHQHYDRIIAEWLNSGRRPVARDITPDHRPEGEITVSEIIIEYWRHAQDYYRDRNGKPSGEQGKIRVVLRQVKRLYGSARVVEFGPLALKAVRQSLLGTSIGRKYCNDQIRRIVRMFAWASENELIDGNVYRDLLSVKGLRRGRTDAPESSPVKPIPNENVDAIRPFVSRQIWAMIELQRFTGMRSGEVCTMRGRDLDMTGRLWLYLNDQGDDTHVGIYLRSKSTVTPARSAS